MSTRAIYLKEKEAAAYLGIAPATLSRWRWSKKGPVFRKFGGAVRYALPDVEAYANSAIEQGFAS